MMGIVECSSDGMSQSRQSASRAGRRAAKKKLGSRRHGRQPRGAESAAPHEKHGARVSPLRCLAIGTREARFERSFVLRYSRPWTSTSSTIATCCVHAGCALLTAVLSVRATGLEGRKPPNVIEVLKVGGRGVTRRSRMGQAARSQPCWWSPKRNCLLRDRGAGWRRLLIRSMQNAATHRPFESPPTFYVQLDLGALHYERKARPRNSPQCLGGAQRTPGVRVRIRRRRFRLLIQAFSHHFLRARRGFWYRGTLTQVNENSHHFFFMNAPHYRYRRPANFPDSDRDRYQAVVIANEAGPRTFLAQ